LRKYTLSKSDSSTLLEFVDKKWPANVSPSKLKNIQAIEIEENHNLLIGESFLAVQVNEIVLPFIGNEEVLKSFPSVNVDMGAIKFVCNGAKVMRPGIVKMDDFNKDDIVVIKDNTHGKFLAIGIALVSSKEAQAMSKGAVVDNIHYVSDQFWEAYKESK